MFHHRHQLNMCVKTPFLHKAPAFLFIVFKTVTRLLHCFIGTHPAGEGALRRHLQAALRACDPFLFFIHAASCHFGPFPGNGCSIWPHFPVIAMRDPLSNSPAFKANHMIFLYASPFSRMRYKAFPYTRTVLTYKRSRRQDSSR